MKSFRFSDFIGRVHHKDQPFDNYRSNIHTWVTPYMSKPQAVQACIDGILRCDPHADPNEVRRAVLTWNLCMEDWP